MEMEVEIASAEQHVGGEEVTNFQLQPQPQQEDDRVSEPQQSPSPSTLPFWPWPCIACGSNCLVKLEVEAGSENRVLTDNGDRDELLMSFCQFLKVKGSCWRRRGDEPVVSLCGACRNQLILLKELQAKIKKLEQDLQNILTGLRKLCQDSESKLEESGVYDKDERYCKIRKQIVRTWGRPRKVAALNSPVPVRRSLRDHSSKKVESESIDKFDSSFSVLDSGEFQQIKTELSVDSELPCDENFPVNFYMDVEDSPIQSNLHDQEKLTKSNSDNVSVEQPVKGEKVGRKKLENRKGQRKSKIKSNPPKSRPSSNARKTFKKSRREEKALELDFDLADTDSGGEAPKRKKRSRRKADVNYQPDLIEVDQITEDNDWNDAEEKEKPRFDRLTGRCAFLHITYMPTNEANKTYLCGECNETIAKSMLRKHAFKYHTTRYKCKDCDHCAGGPADLTRHIRYAHQNKRPECSICGRRLPNVTRLKFHQWTHYNEEEKREALERGEKPPVPKKLLPRFQCEECGKEFTDRWSLKKHKLFTHATDEERSDMMELCQVCGKSVLSLRMKQHMRDIHPSLDRRFNCLHCDKVCKTRALLMKHQRTHKERPFKCTICGSGFVTKESFTGHMNLHNNIRPFKCEIFTLSFASKHILWKHNKTFHVEGSNPRRKPYLRGLKKSGQGNQADTETDG